MWVSVLAAWTKQKKEKRFECEGKIFPIIAKSAIVKNGFDKFDQFFAPLYNSTPYWCIETHSKGSNVIFVRKE